MQLTLLLTSAREFKSLSSILSMICVISDFCLSPSLYFEVPKRQSVFCSDSESRSLEQNTQLLFTRCLQSRRINIANEDLTNK